MARHDRIGGLDCIIFAKSHSASMYKYADVILAGQGSAGQRRAGQRSQALPQRCEAKA